MRKDDVEPTTALRKDCEEIREALASAATDDAKVRHRLGSLVNTIQNDAD